MLNTGYHRCLKNKQVLNVGNGSQIYLRMKFICSDILNKEHLEVVAATHARREAQAVGHPGDDLHVHPGQILNFPQSFEEVSGVGHSFSAKCYMYAPAKMDGLTTSVDNLDIELLLSILYTIICFQNSSL